MRLLGSRKGLVLGVMAQFLQYGAALLLLPLIVIHLSPEQVGLWYIFVAVQGLAMLMDFGFQPSFARNFALAFSGSQALYKEGISRAVGSAANYTLAGKVLYAARAIYAGISLLALALMLSVGTLYIASIVSADESLARSHVIFAWVIFAFAVAVNLYLMWISPFLIGADKVDKNYFYLIANRGTFFLAGSFLLTQGYGLLGLSAAFLFAPLVARVAIARILRPLLSITKQADNLDFFETRAVLATIWHNSKKMGAVSIGAYLITRYNIFVVSYFLGLPAAASYGVTIQILMAINSSSQISFLVSLPKMVRARLEHNIGDLQRLFTSALFFYISSFTLASVCFFFYGNILISHVGGSIILPDGIILALLIVIFLLEGNHSCCALTITTANTVPFVKSALFSGVAICVLSTLSGYLSMGLLGIVLSQGLVQLSYNNWKWPKMVYEELFR